MLVLTSAPAKYLHPHKGSIRLLYYFCGLILCCLNFSPVFETHNSKDYHSPVHNALLSWFSFSFALSIPLWVEFFIDMTVKLLSTRFVKDEKTPDHNLSHAVLLLSLALPFCLCFVRGDDRNNLLFADCFISSCRTMALVAIFGKLQSFSSEHWNIHKCVSLTAVTVAAEVVDSFRTSKCKMGGNCEEYMDYTPKFLFAFCLILNGVFARQYLIEFYRSYFTKNGSRFFTTNRYTCLILVLIVHVYLLTRFHLIFILENVKAGVPATLEAQLAVHVVLACLAAILPGRVVRRMLVTMKNEMEYKETFVRYISHEIRSPLSSSTLGLDYLITQLSSNRETDAAGLLEVVQETKYSVDTATNTLNDLLMYDKIEAGMLEISTAECDMWEFVQHCVKPFSLQTVERVLDSLDGSVAIGGLDIESQRSAKPSAVSAIMVKIDKYKMEQVIRNFMTNALKFTPSGGSITVNVTLQSAYSRPVQPRSSRAVCRALSNITARVEVVDTGPGITEENLPKLFGQYVQFDANTLQGGKGSGLGLWLSKAIVEMHGGVIGASSEGAGQGCTFFLELPVTELCLDESSSPARSPVSGSSRRGLHSRTLSTADSHSRKVQESASSMTLQASTGSIESLGMVNSSGKRIAPELPPLILAQTKPQAVNEIPRIPEEGSGSSSEEVPGRSSVSSLLSSGAKAQQCVMAVITKRLKKHKIHAGVEPELVCPLRALKILIVDDSLISRKMVARTLSVLEGCVCEHASNGKEAVEMVTAAQGGDEQQPFDVILMDCYMPVMNGPDAVRTLRGPQCNYKGLILAVTGVSTESEFDSLLSAGLIDHILVKPFDLEVFKMVVRVRINCESAVDNHQSVVADRPNRS